MRYLFIGCFILLCDFSVQAQTLKMPWVATELYMVKLPESLAGLKNVRVELFNDRKVPIPINVKLAFRKVTRDNHFTYISKPSNQLYGIKLPILLPANTYVYAFNFYNDPNSSLILVDNHLKIRISTTDRSINNVWQLPQIFDTNIENVASVNDYMDSKNYEKVIQTKLYMLNIEKRLDTKLQSNIIDTSIVIDVQDSTKIPIGLKPFFQLHCGNEANAHHCDFIISNAILFRSKLWFLWPLTTNANQTKAVPNCRDCSTIRKCHSIDGEVLTCKDGGLTSGDCIKIFTDKKIYQMEVTIEY